MARFNGYDDIDLKPFTVEYSKKEILQEREDKVKQYSENLAKYYDDKNIISIIPFADEGSFGFIVETNDEYEPNYEQLEDYLNNQCWDGWGEMFEQKVIIQWEEEFEDSDYPEVVELYFKPHPFKGKCKFIY